HAFERSGVAPELDELDVVPGEVVETEIGVDEMVQGRGALHYRQPLSLHVRERLYADVPGPDDRVAGIRVRHAEQPQLLRAPLPLAEHERGLERLIAADAEGGELDLPLAERREAGDVVLARQHAKRDPLLVLQRRADGDRLAVPGRAHVVGGPCKALRKLRRPCSAGCQGNTEAETQYPESCYFAGHCFLP